MEYKPLSGRELPRFSSIKTFYRLPHADKEADYDIGIVGVPFDGGASYRPGARFAPAQIRDYSSLGRGYHWGRRLNLFEQMAIADLGDCPTVPIDLKQTYEKIETYFADLVARKKKFVAVGGDHSTTLPILRSIRKNTDEPLNLIHFDAHLDTFPAAWDCEYHHGSFLRHAVEEGLVDPKKTLQLGIRGPLADDSDLEFVQKHGVHVTTVDDVRSRGLEAFLSELPVFDSGATYISFDIDCLDPSVAPGTGTPVVGGLSTYETQRILRALQIKWLVAADVVEVSPPYDTAGITCLAAVDTIFEILCLFSTSE